MRKRWGGCWGGISCFGKQKGGKRVVPASRMPEVHALGNQPNGPQAAGLANQNTAIAPSLLAPPSSPASFSNSALPSTAQSPSSFLSLSANSPGGPSSTMFATGPYAHETQLVSPPVFSTFTTEPSTAPLTPPPELAHITTPSSPDVPFAQFLSSSLNLKNTDKRNYISGNDLQATYSLYPGSPAGSLRSPISRSPSKCLSASFTEHPKRSESGRLYGPDSDSSPKISQDANFFCPATFAQFYLDQSSFPQSGGRLSVSRESDVFTNAGNGMQNRQTKACKQDVEEIEAYRASFGFSADEIVATAHYVEIADVMDDSFSMMPFCSNKFPMDETMPSAPVVERPKAGETHVKSQIKEHRDVQDSCDFIEGNGAMRRSGVASGISMRSEHNLAGDEDDIFAKLGTSRITRKYQTGLSSSDAEIDYRRSRSLRRAAK